MKDKKNLALGYEACHIVDLIKEGQLAEHELQAVADAASGARSQMVRENEIKALIAKYHTVEDLEECADQLMDCYDERKAVALRRLLKSFVASKRETERMHRVFRDIDQVLFDRNNLEALEDELSNTEYMRIERRQRIAYTRVMASLRALCPKKW